MHVRHVNISLCKWLGADFKPVYKAMTMCPNPLRLTNNFKLGLSLLVSRSPSERAAIS